MSLNGEALVGQISDRRDYTMDRVETLREKLKDAEVISKAKACVYATGSFGRCEASKYSDLDLLIVGKKDGHPGPDGKEGSQLTQLDEICIRGLSP